MPKSLNSSRVSGFAKWMGFAESNGGYADGAAIYPRETSIKF
jgi:hypothetical protein